LYAALISTTICVKPCRETEMLFESVMKDDRSVVDLLGANYTFLNERLARHYGIPNVYGSNFLRVALSEGSNKSTDCTLLVHDCSF
jgi:hypothetical protein